MDNVLDFVISNPIAIIAGAIFLFSLMGKGKKKQENRMPSFGGDTKGSSHEPEYLEEYDEEDEDEKDYGRQSRPEIAQRATPVFTSSGQHSYNDDSVESREWSSLNRPAMNHRTAATYSAAASESKYSEQSGSPFMNEGVTAEEVRKGIIWAEILGPPRAKRPFRNR